MPAFHLIHIDMNQFFLSFERRIARTNKISELTMANTSSKGKSEDFFHHDGFFFTRLTGTGSVSPTFFLSVNIVIRIYRSNVSNSPLLLCANGRVSLLTGVDQLNHRENENIYDSYLAMTPCQRKSGSRDAASQTCYLFHGD